MYDTVTLSARPARIMSPMALPQVSLRTASTAALTPASSSISSIIGTTLVSSG